MDTSLVIRTGDCVGTGNQASAEVKSIQTISKYTDKDLSSEDPEVGNVSSTIGLTLATLPQEAKVSITTFLEPDTQASSAFQLAATGAGAGDFNVAYTINVQKTNLENDRDILDATITMVIGKEWVEANGGIENVYIIRFDFEKDIRQVLETKFMGYDAQGRAIFQALSPDGLSVFGLISFIKPVVHPETSVPTATPLVTPVITTPAVTTQAQPATPATEPSNWGLIISLIVVVIAVILIVILVMRNSKDRKK
jgi:hypothetical protein